MLPTPVYGLWLTGVGTEPSNWCCFVPSCRISQHCLDHLSGGVKPALTRSSLSDARVIMVIMCVHVVELLC
jgi:hypothetical protein